jgi:hypothetical protein
MKNKITILKLSLSLLSIIAISDKSFAQPVFEKTYGSPVGDERGQFAGPANGGGIIICGATLNPPYDAIFMKTDDSGVLQWSKKITGAGDEVLNCIRPTSDGGYISVGYTSTSGAGGKDVLLVKLTSTGTVSWTKTYGTTTDDIGYDVRQTTDGGYIITGDAKKSTSSVVGAVYLIKTDNTGALTWSNMWGAGLGNEGRTVIQTSDGGYFVGANSSTGYFYIIKTTSTGSVTWARSNLAMSMSSVSLFQAIQTSDGGYALIGNAIRTSDNNIDIALVKTNSTGVVQFWKTYGGTAIDFGKGIQEVAGGNFLVVGYTASFGSFSNIIVLRIASTGALSGAKTASILGSNGGGQFLNKTADGGYAYTSSRNNSVYIFKSDASGYTGCTSTVASPTDNTLTSLFDVATTPTGNGTTTVNSPSYTSAALTLSTTSICTGVGIDEISIENSISIFPNPATNSIQITIESQFVQNEMGIKIYDLLGKLVYNNQNALSNNSSAKINVAEIPNGIYFVTIYSKNNSYSKRLIIQH